MTFKSDKQRKGFFARHNISSISDLSFKAKQKILDIETKRALSNRKKEEEKLNIQLEKEKQRQLKASDIARRKTNLEKIKLEHEIQEQKILDEKQKIIDEKKQALKTARSIQLTPDQQKLFDARQKRKQDRLNKLEDKRLKLRSGLIKGGKLVGRGLVAGGKFFIESISEEQKPRRRKSAKKKTVKRKKR